MRNVRIKQNVAKGLLLTIIMFLALCVSFVMVSMSAKAESNGKLIFNLINGGTEYDVCIDDKSQTRVVIPSTYKGKPVTTISDNGFALSQSLEVVIIPSSIKKIGSNAFLNCKNLKTVITPNVEIIGQNAFALCPKILQFAIRDSVETIGATAFRGLTAASTIYVEPSSMKPNWNANCFASCKATILYETYTPADLELEEMENGEGWRVGYKDINNPFAQVVISPENTPDGRPILEIGSFAFTGCELDKLTVEDSSHTINIQSNAFNGAIINEIDLGPNVTYYDEFSEEAMVEPNSGKLISDSVFASSPVSKLSIGFNHSFIPRNMFNGLVNLSELEINGITNELPVGIQYINENAFKMIYNIQRIFIPASLIKIGQNAFAEWGTTMEQEIIIDKFNISDEERAQCGNATITVRSIAIEYVTNSTETIESNRIDRFISNQTFPIPKKDGYDFIGWFDEQGTDSYGELSGTGNQIANSEGLMLPLNLEAYKDTKFYAKWEIERFKITWVFNGAKGEGTFKESYTVRDSFILPNVSLPGYEFSGWSPNSGGGDYISEISPNSMARDITLYAIFKATINIDGTGGYSGREEGCPWDPFENKTITMAIGTTYKTDDIFKPGYYIAWTDGNQTVGKMEQYTVTGHATLKAKFDEMSLDECLINHKGKIYTANQLNEIRFKTNATTKIEVSIDDNITVNDWVPIPEFNGSISTLEDYRIIINGFNANSENVGFIAKNYGHLQLSIEANVSISGGKYAGIIVGENAPDGYLMVCETFGNINSTAEYTGGVVGCNYGMVMYPINKANVTSSEHVGGIIGYQGAGGYNQSCQNYGKINFSCVKIINNAVGGIVGHDNGESYGGFNYAYIEFIGSVPWTVMEYRPYVGGAIGYSESGHHSMMKYKKDGFIRGTLTNSQMKNVQDFSDGTL